MKIYVDSLLLLNFIINYLILLAAAKISGQVFRRGRLVLAALFGAVYALLVFLPWFQFLAGPPGKLFVGVVMVILAFGVSRRTARLALLVLGVSFAFAGAAMLVSTLSGSAYSGWNAIYVPVDFKTLVLVTGLTYLALGFVYRRTAAYHGQKTGLAEIRALGSTVKLSCLMDTGNTLKDPVTNEPVTIVHFQVLNRLMKGNGCFRERDFLDPTTVFRLVKDAYPQAKVRLLPYSAVGVGSGLLVTLKCDSVAFGKRVVKGGLIAFSPNLISDNESYEAIAGIV